MRSSDKLTTSRDARTEIAAGERFAFGENWERFGRVVDERRIAGAVESLERLLAVSSLAGRTFLDVGCGSGLFSLAAVRLGAARVHSFDYDASSVNAARELKRRFAPDAAIWSIDQGSVLDDAFLGRLGSWDIVYSWGVLHHTGQMWTAIDRTVGLVAPGGQCAIAIYNDQGWQSTLWLLIKRWYNASRTGRLAIAAATIPAFAIASAAADLVRGRNPFARYRSGTRGMSPVRDWFDWLGGYPFEVASPSRIIQFAEQRGCRVARVNSVGRRLGCNEFVFVR